MDDKEEHNPPHMEVYHYTGAWKPIPVKSQELAGIWAIWHSEQSVQDLKTSITKLGVIASSHIEELFNHIAYLELEYEQLARRLART